ncbi:hypothetical protein [Thauera humireducens]|uniref:hypothetical protein n=1 Tax=Thauera humireducens TaxID=1134435 RepID=UPI0031203E51
MSQKQNTRTPDQVESALAFRGYSTARIAKQLDVKPASIRTAVWRHGHFHGVRPIRLGGFVRKDGKAAGGHLVWPADEIDALLQRGAA